MKVELSEAQLRVLVAALTTHYDRVTEARDNRRVHSTLADRVCAQVADLRYRLEQDLDAAKRS